MFYWRGEHEGVQLGFTSAEVSNLAAHVGSADAARRNRVALERVTGSLRFLNQTHSADVHDALEPTDSPPSGDAWVCEDGSVSLAVAVADCLPVLLVGGGPRGPVTAAAHAGRSGLMAGVLENTVRAMRQRRAQSIRAWIGPGACGSCYEVPQEMVNDLASHRPGLASLTRWGTPALDLRAHAPHSLRSSQSMCTMWEGAPSKRLDSSPTAPRRAGAPLRAGSPGSCGSHERPRSQELSKGLAAVNRRIDAAVASAGRSVAPELIVVTKYFPAEDAVRLVRLGAAQLGENKDQEAAAKAKQVAEQLENESPRWHFIGQLQSNKAKSVARYAHAVHSVDRGKLVAPLSRGPGRAGER